MILPFFNLSQGSGGAARSDEVCSLVGRQKLLRRFAVCTTVVEIELLWGKVNVSATAVWFHWFGKNT